MNRTALVRLLPGLAAASFVSVLVLTSGCYMDRIPPPGVFGPAGGYQNAPTVFRFLSDGSGNSDLVVDWGDRNVDTLVDNSPGDTVYTSHIWAAVGDYRVKAFAMLTEKNDVSSDWSPEFSITVLPNDVPIADFDGPMQARVDVETGFSVWGVDQNGENVSLMMKFGDEESDWSEYVPSGESLAVVHTFEDVGETLWVSARARDIHGASGPWSDSVRLITTDAGGMLWWVAYEDSLWPSTATVVVDYNGTEYVYFGAYDGHYERIYGVDFATGKRRFSATHLFPELENFGWTNHPVYNKNTGHIVICHSDGELYAFDRELNRVWTFPGATCPGHFTYTRWRLACIAGSNIYVPNVDTIIRGSDTIPDVTKFYKIPDGPDRPVNPRFAVLGVQEVRGAPVADASGSVFFVTDSGYLYKLDSDLVEQWRVRPGNSTWLYGPVIGQAGAVICGDGDGKVCAVNPEDGLPLWTTMLPDVGEMYIAVGRSGVFVAAANGHVYSLSPGSGDVQWDKPVSTGGGFVAYPILTANGLMYVLDDNTRLFCIEQATGNKVWDIACADYYPGGGLRGAGIDDPPPSPTITSSGSVIIAGEHALYCVSGYSDGTLDTGAPWPKWQHDLHNTGHWPGW